MASDEFAGSGATRRSRSGMGLVWALAMVVALAVAAVIAVLSWSVITGGARPGPGLPAASASASPVAAVPSEAPSEAPTGALAVLAAIPAVEGTADADYDRAWFGQAWADVDRNGCDTRNDILGRDLIDPAFKDGTRDCKVLTGTLIDPYDGQRVDFVSGAETSVLVQIDHVVPLSWAWRHGAENWTNDDRKAFANDPRNLLAASQEMNQGKGASGPSQWLPPLPELHCEYVETWVDILDQYHLGMNPADRAAAESVLRDC